MPQPAAPSGRPELPPVFFLASTNKKKLFPEYEKSAEAGIINFETFRHQWQIHAPEVVIIKTHSDVCYICDKHHELTVEAAGFYRVSLSGKCTAGNPAAPGWVRVLDATSGLVLRTDQRLVGGSEQNYGAFVDVDLFAGEVLTIQQQGTATVTVTLTIESIIPT